MRGEIAISFKYAMRRGKIQPQFIPQCFRITTLLDGIKSRGTSFINFSKEVRKLVVSNEDQRIF